MGLFHDMKIPTYKITESGSQRRGRPKNSKDKKPRLSKVVANIRSEQARLYRLARTRRAEVEEALGGAVLPTGVSVNDLTPMQAQALAMEQQGMAQQASQMREQAAQWARQDAANTTAEQLLRDQSAAAANTEQLLRSAETELQRQTALSREQAVNLDKLRLATIPSFANVATKLSAAKPTVSEAAAASPSPQAAAATPRRSGRRRRQTGDGLDPIRIAMDLAESGDVEGAKALLRRLKREKADPLSRATNYVEQL